jgi:phospholipase C
MAPVLPQIKTVVYIMMENRSFDNLLGWLYTGTPGPRHFYPTGNTTPYDGLVANKYFNPAWSKGVLKQFPVTTLPAEYQSERVPAWDPYEAMREDSSWNGVMNQLYGNQDMINGMPATGSSPAMLGFLQDYYQWEMVDWEGLDILWTYQPNQLQAINTLAMNYAVSDHWFSSVPTQTNPNRAYSLCGTSLGREANANLEAVEQFNVPTLINSLAGAGKSWGLFYEDLWRNNQCYTQYTFPQISKAANATIGTVAQFKALAAQGKLPAFSYLEPKWGYGAKGYVHQGTDYHPPTLVGPGDQYLWDLFTACRFSPQWKNLLFFVTFDEHGGCYDHAKPKWNAINPDGIKGTKWGFNFQLYGARIPTLLISPFVASGTVFREPAGSSHPYDHTSFIRTMLAWAGIDPAKAGLGNRVPAAPMFDQVLATTAVNADEATLIDFAPIPGGDAAVAGRSAPGQVIVNDRMEGVAQASVRAILERSNSLEEIDAAVARYRADPAGFERELWGEP